MSLEVRKSSDFVPENVCFSSMRKNKNGGKAVYLNMNKNQKILMQLPYLRAPFGLSSYTDESTKRTSYSLDLSFDSENQELQDMFEKLDNHIVSTVAENSTEWLGKKYNVAVMKEALYKPIVRPGKGDYPSTIKLKILCDTKSGEFVPEAYNHMRERVPLDSIEKSQKALCIIDLNQIWFIDNKFGVSVRLQQVLLEPSKKLPSFAFKDVETQEEEVDDEEFDEQ